MIDMCFKILHQGLGKLDRSFKASHICTYNEATVRMISCTQFFGSCPPSSAWKIFPQM